MALWDTISRRQVLILGGVAVAAAALPGSLAFIERGSNVVADDLVAMLADPDGAADIGQKWIDAAGQAPARPWLASRRRARDDACRTRGPRPPRFPAW